MKFYYHQVLLFLIMHYMDIPASSSPTFHILPDQTPLAHKSHFPFEFLKRVVHSTSVTHAVISIDSLTLDRLSLTM